MHFRPQYAAAAGARLAEGGDSDDPREADVIDSALELPTFASGSLRLHTVFARRGDPRLGQYVKAATLSCSYPLDAQKVESADAALACARHGVLSPRREARSAPLTPSERSPELAAIPFGVR